MPPCGYYTQGRNMILRKKITAFGVLLFLALGVLLFLTVASGSVIWIPRSFPVKFTSTATTVSTAISQLTNTTALGQELTGLTETTKRATEELARQQTREDLHNKKNRSKDENEKKRITTDPIAVSNKTAISAIQLRGFLLLVSIFKNEEDGLQEWLTHYSNQGVDKVLLLNDASIDRSRSVLAPWVNSGWVDVVDVVQNQHGRENFQVWAYNTLVVPYTKWYAWRLVVDIDEYVYYPYANLSAPCNPEGDLKSFLKTVHPHIRHITLPWKMFGRSNLQAHKPGSIRTGCTRRSDKHGEYVPHKSFSRNPLVGEETITVHKVPLANAFLSDLTTKSDSPSGEHDKFDLKTMRVHLNHYPLQSWDWFKKVKITRGDVNMVKNIRDRGYFDMYNAAANDTDDTSLKEHSCTRAGISAHINFPLPPLITNGARLIVAIGSIINITSSEPYEYAVKAGHAVRSHFNSLLRFNQTVTKTIASVRAQLPNAHIVLLEQSAYLQPNVVTQLTALVDSFVMVRDVAAVGSVIDGQCKGCGEAATLSVFAKALAMQEVNYTHLIKISGRYWLEDDFSELWAKHNTTRTFLVAPAPDGNPFASFSYVVPRGLLARYLQQLDAFRYDVGHEMIMEQELFRGVEPELMTVLPSLRTVGLDGITGKLKGSRA